MDLFGSSLIWIIDLERSLMIRIIHYPMEYNYMWQL